VTIEAPYYPIVYVRGYAATMSEIENTVATPYMGFNSGSTKIRQDYRGDIKRFIFESPLIRLMKDEKYIDAYQNGDFIEPDKKVTTRSVWIFRYYEPVSADLGDGKRQTLPHFAYELRKFILRIRDQVCGNNAAMRKKFKVHLVAHSMGGLVCRCYLQNICKHGVGDAFEKSKLPTITEQKKLGLHKTQLPAAPLVDKVFTYATPHNGIEVGGFNVPDIGPLDRLHARNFNRDYMRDYLRLPKRSKRVDSLNKAFPEDRFFCFVGSNYRDYEAFLGLSKKATGPMSDGLVMINNASVQGAPRAVAHRSHSGDYGIVNSEEGYQNLRRFLFGNVRIDFRLLIDEITLPAAIEKAVKGKRERVQAAYNIETAASLRGLNVFLNERRVAQQSAIRRTYERLVHQKKGKQIYLFSGYLMDSGKMPRSADDALAFTVELGVQVPVYEVDNRFWLDDHFEGGYVFKDTITLHVFRNEKQLVIKYGLASISGLGVADKALSLKATSRGQFSMEIPIGFSEGATNPPKPGMRGKFEMIAGPWI